MPIDCFVFCTFIEWEAKTPTLTVAKMDESNFARSKKNSWFVDTIVFKGTTFGHNSPNADQKKKKRKKSGNLRVGVKDIKAPFYNGISN